MIEEKLIMALIILSVINYFLIPKIAKLLKKHGMKGIDHHKKDKPEIAEGAGMVFSLSISLLLLLTYVFHSSVDVLYVVLISVLFGLIGFLDDVGKIDLYKKLYLSLFAGVITIAFFFGSNITFLIFSFLFVVVIGNAINIFAGLNGLEIGLSVLVGFFMAVLSFIEGLMIPFYIFLSYFVLVSVFLIYNKYPSKVFPGDSGTLFTGGLFASVSIVYGLYPYLLILLVPHITDCILKFFSFGYSTPSIKKSGDLVGEKLKPRKDFSHLIGVMLDKIPEEKRAVRVFWLIEILIGSGLVLVIS